ncbi:MAG TPA: hypothetical protein VI456_04470 [Polyangia bacterium]
MVQRSGWIGFGVSSALTLVLAAGCGGSNQVPTEDGGRDAKPARTDGGRDAKPVRSDGGKDATVSDSGRDTMHEDGASDAARDALAADALPPGCEAGPQGEPTDLRCTGLYADWASKTVAANVRQYDPGLHLWSDGASKTRWIYLPPGTKIDTSDMDEWAFSPGTKVWKEFVVDGARLETRLLWKRPSGNWYFTTYRWAADGSSAPELTDGELDADGNNYEIPTQSACYDCHNGRIDAVLGFEAVALSSPQAAGVTMATLTAQNLLTDPPTSPLTIPGDAPTAAALGYLHMNCGNPCHNDGNGEAANTGLWMRLGVATLTSPQATDTWTTGVGAHANYALTGVDAPQDFTPCDPDQSAAYYRMDHRDGVDGAMDGTQMPPIVSHQVDPDGVALVAAWLNGFPQCPSGSTTP